MHLIYFGLRFLLSAVFRRVIGLEQIHYVEYRTSAQIETNYIFP